MHYDRNVRTPEYCNGTTWNSMGPSRYVPNGVIFDSYEYLGLTGALTGAGPSSQVAGSFWFRVLGQTQTTKKYIFAIYSGTNPQFTILITTANKLEFVGYNNGGTKVLDQTAPTVFNTDNNWHHVAYSFDLTNAARKYVYIDDVSQTLSGGTFSTGNTIQFGPTTTPLESFGALPTGAVATKFVGSLADFWMNTGTFIDLTMPATLRYFIDATLKPVNLGPNGSLGPTGAAPLIYMSGPTSSWPTNNGSGGGSFTAAGGTLIQTDGLSPQGTAVIVNQMQQLGTPSADFPRALDNMAGKGIYLFATTDGYFLVINISNPASMSVVAAIADTDYANGGNDSAGLVLSGNYVFTATSGRIITTDISNPLAPVKAATFPNAHICPGEYSCLLTMHGNYIYTSDYANHVFSVIDATNPLSLSVVGTLTNANISPSDLEADSGGNYVYAENNNSDVFDIINVSTPTAPVLTKAFTDANISNQGPYAIVQSPLNPNIIYLGNDGGGGTGVNANKVEVIDVTNKSLPSVLGTFYVPWGPTIAMKAGGNRLYMSNYANGGWYEPVLNVYDTTDPAHPVFLGTSDNYATSTCGNDFNLAVVNNVIFAGSSDLCSFSLIEGGSCTGPTGKEGDVQYNNTSHSIQYCDGSSWIGLGPTLLSTGSGCTGPTGAEGILIYNSDSNKMQYCNGTNWIQAGE